MPPIAAAIWKSKSSQIAKRQLEMQSSTINGSNLLPIKHHKSTRLLNAPVLDKFAQLHSIEVSETILPVFNNIQRLPPLPVRSAVSGWATKTAADESDLQQLLTTGQETSIQYVAPVHLPQKKRIRNVAHTRPKAAHDCESQTNDAQENIAVKYTAAPWPLKDLSEKMHTLDIISPDDPAASPEPENEEQITAEYTWTITFVNGGLNRTTPAFEAFWASFPGDKYLVRDHIMERLQYMIESFGDVTVDLSCKKILSYAHGPFLIPFHSEKMLNCILDRQNVWLI